jgi:ABC-type nitrate/sulfonate/bicarbonate transport system substrate-binding protein
LFAAAAIAFACTAVAGCGGDDSSATAGGGASKPDAKPAQLSVTPGGVNVVQSNVWVAQQAGFFEQQGLDVKITVSPGNTPTLIASGREDVGDSSAANALVPVGDGIETALIYNASADTAAAFVAGAPDVKSLADCKSLVTAATGTSLFSWATMFTGYPNVTDDIVPIADPASISPTLISGRSNCGVGTRDLLAGAVAKAKFHYIVDPTDPSTLPPEFPKNYSGAGGAFWGLAATFKERRSDIVKFLRAIRQADEFIQSKPPAEVAQVLLKSPDWKPFDAETVAGQIERAKPFLAPNKGEILESEWPTSLEHFAVANKAIKVDDPKWSFKSRVDNSYLEEALGK